MDPRVGSALISGGASLLSGALGIGANRSAEDRAFERNMQLMRLQNQFNVQMWHRQNEYNSPSHQLKMLQDAGVNPAVSDFFGGSGSTASEVTSAPAEAPYNSQIGDLVQAINPTDKVIQALTSEAQIQKLRTDIVYQKLLNRDFQNELSAREELLPQPLSSDEVEYDSNGNPIITVRPGYNSYQENRAQRRMNLGTSGIEQQLRSDELEVYQASKPFLKQMSDWQLRNLKEDLNKKLLDNSLLEEDVRMMKKYGITSRDQSGWTTLLRAMLHNPDSVNNILDRLIEGVGKTIPNVLDQNYRPIINMYNRIRGVGSGHRNPRGKR